MYASVAHITQAFPAAQWDPTKHEPDTATVTAWLTDWSKTIDAQIAGVVIVPVVEADSPNLYALCDQIVALLVRADVYDAKYPPKSGEQVTTRQSYVWRKQAQDLVKDIQAGNIADGTAAAGNQLDATPTGSFGTGTGRFGQRDGVW